MDTREVFPPIFHKVIEKNRDGILALQKKLKEDMAKITDKLKKTIQTTLKILTRAALNFQ